MFFGFVGLFNAALLWPGLIFCHFTGNEKFEMPTIKQWEFLIINGFIGTVLSELLWLLGCFCKNSSIYMYLFNYYNLWYTIIYTYFTCSRYVKPFRHVSYRVDHPIEVNIGCPISKLVKSDGHIS